MNPWTWVARHCDGTQRLDDWRRVLGSAFPAWEPFLDSIRDPIGIRFWADFGSGEEEHELFRSPGGFVAGAIDGGAVIPLNPTQAEFRTLRMTAVLQRISREARLEGDLCPLQQTAAAFRLGTRRLG